MRASSASISSLTAILAAGSHQPFVPNDKIVQFDSETFLIVLTGDLTSILQPK